MQKPGSCQWLTSTSAWRQAPLSRPPNRTLASKLSRSAEKGPEEELQIVRNELLKTMELSRDDEIEQFFCIDLFERK